ncbi:hypothetical protein [Helicobacter pylori]|uniref:hypothetical protein n=1 Tax=Helicobacter pylori TaxID=210 RepID=UPI00038E1332|nr:hypothetical protein [Helicobacter pylori]EQL70713.1 hypothetical protein N407_02550 [Helicobacter pylori FD662]
MNIIKILSLLFFVMCNSIFATNLETETKKDKKSDKKLYDFTKNSALEGIDLEKSPTLKGRKKSDKKLYDFTKNSALEGIDLEKSPTLKGRKKSDKKFYKQLAKNNIAEGVSMPVVNFNKALSFGPYFERTKSKKTQYMDGGLMMHIRF